MNGQQRHSAFVPPCWSNFRIQLSRSDQRLLVFLLVPCRAWPPDRAAPAQTKPRREAPRRGDCGPDAEGRVHLLPGQLGWSSHQSGRRSVRFV